MDCSEAHKVQFCTHQLAEEADDWWVGTRQRLTILCEAITWVVFNRKFLRKYFPEHVCGKKEIEFLELKQGNLTMTEYALKFVELAKYYPYYCEAISEFLRCIKFENVCIRKLNGKLVISRSKIFSKLVNSYRKFEEDNKTHSTHYKSLNEKRVLTLFWLTLCLVKLIQQQYVKYDMLTCWEEQVEQEFLFYEEHVELKCFNIQSNMSDKMSYAGSFCIAPVLGWTVGSV